MTKYLVTAENSYGEMVYNETKKDWDAVKASLRDILADYLDVNSVKVWQLVPTTITLNIEAEG